MMANQKPLLNLWALTRDEDGEWAYHLQVVSCLSDNYYLGQCHSWLDGHPTNLKIFSLSELSTGYIFKTNEDLIAFYEATLNKSQ